MNITFFLYDGITAMDVTGPYEVFCRLPDARVQFAAKQKGDIETDYKFLKFKATHSIEEIKKTDILVIPGSTVSFLEIVLDKAILNWINRIHETTLWTTSVSSGSVILAATGMLDDKKITSHWYTSRILENYDVEFVHQRYVQEGKIITSAGVTAGIDMALYLTEKVSGKEFAEAMRLMLEYDPQPPIGGGSLKKSSDSAIYIAQKKLKEDAIRMRKFTVIGL